MKKVKYPKCKMINSLKLFKILSFTSQLLFSLIFTVNLLYHVNVAKLNPLQLVLVGTILELSVFLFEIPTGIVADTKSRKLSIVIGYLLMGIGFVLEGLFPFFTFIAISQVIWGLGYTFTSGATQAWITDEIGEEKVGRAFILGEQYGQAGELIAIPISVLVGLIAINLPIIIGGTLMILFAFFLAFRMQEHDFKTRAKNELSGIKSMLDTSKAALIFIKGKRVLILLLTIGVFYGLYSEGFDRLWIAHLMENFPSSIIINSVLLIGIVRCISLVLSILSLGMINKKLDFNNSKHVIRILVISAVIIILSLIGFSLFHNLYAALLFFWVIGIMRSITNPLLDAWLNSLITNPNIRATLFSVRGQIDSLGQIGGGPVVGMIGNLFSIRTALFVCAIILSPIIYLYHLVLKKQ